MRIHLPYGKTHVPVDVPDRNILTVVKPNMVTPEKNYREIIKDALENPVNSKRLKDIKGKKFAVVVDDYTRPCPTKKMLPFVLNEIKGDATVIFACGTHEPVENPKEILGMDIKNMSSQAESNDFRYIGTTSMGTDVKLNKAFLDADVKILLGDVELHYFAGYGGGRKSVLPGVSSYETIQSNHKLMFDPNAKLGNLKDNPVHLDMMEAYNMADVDFVLNVVQNPEHQIVDAFAGSHDAFFEGVKLVDKMCKIKVNEKADIVVASADGSPHDINLYQSMKALQTVKEVIKDNGVLILVAECRNGHGSEQFYNDMKKYKTGSEVRKDLMKNFVMGRHKTYYMLNALEKYHVVLVSSMQKKVVENVFRIKYAKNVEAALKTAFDITGRDASVLVSPNATTTMAAIG
ncbi:MAG: nickel-dependent lactate racemase [Thermoplasmatales archaeon]|nr:nickel-dependent lactate racemase [Thermoplasmatales archaeon]